MENLQDSDGFDKETINEIREGRRQKLLDIIQPAGSEQESGSNENISFSILSYNLLAESLSKKFIPYVEKRFHDFKNRAPVIIEEIKNFSGDIICLQEVDNFDAFYKDKIQEIGYQIVYASKSNGDPDGVLVGVKKEMFEIINHDVIKYDEYEYFETSPDFKRGNVAIFAKIKHKPTNEILHIINTHFFFDPRFEHIKYLQMAQIIRYVNTHLSDQKDRIIWAGDLNSLPHSNALQYVLKGAAPRGDNLESETPDMIHPMMKFYEKLEQIEKKVKWANAYEIYGSIVQEPSLKFPAFTNYTFNFKGTLDHFLYSKENLTPKKLLKVPTEAELNTTTLPNRRYPSDHLPIMAVFEILK